MVEAALWASEQLARRQVEAMHQALNARSGEPALQDLLAHVVDTMHRQLGAQSVCLRLQDETGPSPVHHWGPERAGPCAETAASPSEAWNLPRWPEDILAQEIVRLRKPVLCEDIAGDPRVGAYRSYLMSQGIQTVLAVPLLVAGKVVGFVGIGSARRHWRRPSQVKLAQAFAHQVTLAIQLAQLVERSRQAAVLEERNRMARDIHDTLAQGFTGILAQLAVVEDALAKGEVSAAGQHLRHAGELARHSLGEARRSVLALRSQALAGGDLPTALNCVIKQVTPGTGLRAALRVEGRPRPLPADRAEHLLRIGQEALTNTLRHARASRFAARLIYHPNEILLELSDNGRGFKPATSSPGLGLAGMKERVEQMGGRLTIRSTSGEGTGIFVALPAPAAARAAAA